MVTRIANGTVKYLHTHPLCKAAQTKNFFPILSLSSPKHQSVIHKTPTQVMTAFLLIRSSSWEHQTLLKSQTTALGSNRRVSGQRPGERSGLRVFAMSLEYRGTTRTAHQHHIAQLRPNHDHNFVKWVSFVKYLRFAFLTKMATFRCEIKNQH